jgi:DNA-binding GntR family transcriptional regulator
VSRRTAAHGLSTAKRTAKTADEAERGRHPVYGQIKSDILSLALPPGLDLDEVSLSRRYGVSRTPIREALIRLSSEHLVELGQSRARVSALILADYPRFIEALDLTRRGVARLAALRRHPADLAKIVAAEAAFAQAARKSRAATDAFARNLGPLETTLHLAIADAGHNRYLTQSYRQLLTLGHRMLHLPYAYDPHAAPSLPAFIKSVIASHRHLVAAIDDGLADDAEKEAGALTGVLVKRLRGYLEENLAAGVTLHDGLILRTSDHARRARPPCLD